MSDEKTESTGLFNLTSPVVCAFPNLFEPRRFKRKGKEAGEPKYGGTFVLNPESADWKALKALAQKLAMGAGHTLEDIKEGRVKMPYQSGNKRIEKRKAELAKSGKEYKGDADFQKDMGVIAARSKFPARLSAFENGKIVDIDFEDAVQKAKFKNRFYSGVEVYAQFNLVPYDAVDDGKPGVTAYLNLVLSTGKGKRIGNQQSAADVFKGVAGQVSAEDPTADLDDSGEDF